MKRRRLVLTVGALCAAAAAQAQSIELLTLRYRTAADVLPVLQPLVEPGGALTGQGNQLFLRASPTNRRQIEQVLAQLDRPPRQLLISVRQDRADESQSREIGVDGRAVITNRGITGSGVVGARDDRNVGTRNSEQSVRVLEGGRAGIAMGAAVPFSFRRWLPQANGGWVVTDQTVFYEALTGFDVRVQLAGDVATLDITPQDAVVQSGQIERTRVATQVQVRLGEWVSIGGADARSSASSSGLLSSGSSAQTSTRGVWVRVQAAD